MKAKKKQRLAELILIAQQSLPTAPQIPEKYPNGLLWLLEDETIEDIAIAFKVHLQQSNFLPSAAELIKIINKSKEEEQRLLVIEHDFIIDDDYDDFLDEDKEVN